MHIYENISRRVTWMGITLHRQASNERKAYVCTYKCDAYFLLCEEEGSMPLYEIYLKTNLALPGYTCYKASSADDSSLKPLQNHVINTTSCKHSCRPPTP